MVAPQPYRYWSVNVREFLQHPVWNDDLAIKRAQKVDALDLDQVIERRGIGNDDQERSVSSQVR
jgi:hypothetical protein